MTASSTASVQTGSRPAQAIWSGPGQSRSAPCQRSAYATRSARGVRAQARGRPEDRSRHAGDDLARGLGAPRTRQRLRLGQSRDGTPLRSVPRSPDVRGQPLRPIAPLIAAVVTPVVVLHAVGSAGWKKTNPLADSPA